MEKMSLDEVKSYQIEIYKVVSYFCDQHNISYWIDSGSLIGTIRHKGYIPWDDDIDIGMLRPDFEKMKEIFNKQNNRYRFSCVDIDKSAFTAYGKVFDTSTILYEPDENGYKSNINIDVFVYDNAPNSDFLLRLMYFRRNFYQLMNGFQTKVFNDHGKVYKKIILTALYKLTNLFPKNYYINKISKNSKRYAKKNTDRVGNFTALTEMKCNKRVFDSFIEKEFENILVRVPVGYDEWLTEYYGEYMKLPPKEKQVSHHRYIAYKI